MMNNTQTTFEGKFEKVFFSTYKKEEYKLILHTTSMKGAGLISFENTPFNRVWFLPNSTDKILSGKMTKGNFEKISNAVETVDIDRNHDYFTFDFTLETEKARGYECQEFVCMGYEQGRNGEPDDTPCEIYRDSTQWVPKSILKDDNKVPAWFVLKMDQDEHSYDQLVKIKMRGNRYTFIK